MACQLLLASLVMVTKMVAATGGSLPTIEPPVNRISDPRPPIEPPVNKNSNSWPPIESPANRVSDSRPPIEPPAHKINDGSFVNISKVPWQVCISYEGNHICGGSIISKDWVITAAHCTYGLNVSLVTLRVGSSNSSSGGQVYHVDKDMMHSGYSNVTWVNDITLLKTSTPISFVGSVSVVKLPTTEPLIPNTGLTVTGWGNTGDDSPSVMLKGAQMFLLDFAVCKETFGSMTVESDQICCDRNDGIACGGDSGGPVMMGDVLVGLVSYGFGICGKGPFVSTKVSAYMEWIKKISGV